MFENLDANGKLLLYSNSKSAQWFCVFFLFWNEDLTESQIQKF